MTNALWQDVRFGTRQLRRNVGFTLAAVLTLALGIGANTAIFSVVNGVLLRPPPHAAPEQLVFLWEGSPSFPEGSPSLPTFADWRERQQSFVALAGVLDDTVDLTGIELPERLPVQWVTADLLPMLGVQPALGRTFTAEEDTPRGPRAVLLTHGAWVRRFGAGRDVLGRTLTLDGAPFTVVGVLPEGFHLLGQADAWVPLAHADAELHSNRGLHPGLQGVGRLKPGVTLSQARADMESVGRALQEAHPESNAGLLPRLEPLHAHEVRKLRPSLLALMGSVALVLLIATINVANLLLARGATRRRELTIRAALGAGRGRLVQQLLVESALLSLAGGLLGLLLAVWGVDALADARPASIPAAASFSVDARVLAFALGVSVAVGLTMGVLPALLASRVQLTGATDGGGVRGRRVRARDALVVAEVALALALLVVAALLMRTFLHLRGTELGFRPDGLLTLRTFAPPTRYPGAEELRAFPERDEERRLPRGEVHGRQAVVPVERVASAAPALG